MGVGPRVVTVLLLVIAAAACHQSARLASVQPEPAGAHCANGGVVIRTGGDDNGNGELDASEIDSESYVCAGEGGTTGHDALADTQPIAPGAECTNGGTRVRTGVDVDDDGILDDSEVIREVVVCAPDAGAATAIATRYEPPGSNCELGGTAIESGLDTNANGVLDASEVTSATFVCNGQVPTTDVVIGNVFVRTGFDIALLAGVKRVIGSVFVRPQPGIDPVRIPRLEQIDNDLVIGDAGTFELPSLAAVGTVSSRNSSIITIQLPSLASATAIQLEQDTRLATLELPALTTVETLSLADLPALGATSFPALATVRDLAIARVPLPTTLELPSLTGATGSITLSQLAITSLAAPLASVTGDLVVSDCAALQQIVLPTLSTVGGTLTAQRLNGLARLDLGMLASAGGLVLSRLPVLPETGLVIAPITQLPRLTVEGLPWTTLAPVDTLQTAGNVLVNLMPALVDADLPALQTVDGLVIGGCAHLPRVDGYAALQAFTNGGGISIGGNPELAVVDGFAQITSIGTLAVNGNPSLTALSGFRNLTAARDILIQDDAALPELVLPPALASVATITISSNARLVRIIGPDALASLPWLGVDTPALETIEGFDNVTTAVHLAITSGALTTVAGFGRLVSASDLFIESGRDVLLAFPAVRDIDSLLIRSPLTSLGGLASLRSVGAVFFESFELTTLRMPQLTSLGQLSFNSAPALVTIDLPQLVTIGGLDGNDLRALETVSMPALAAITGGDGAFAGIDAQRLPLCQITQLFAQTGFTGEEPLLPPCHAIDRCRLVAPLDAIVTAGSPVEASGRLAITGVTDLTPGIDDDVVLRAALGFGATGTDPTTDPSWTFVPAAARAGWDDATAPGFDEYVVPVAFSLGLHDVAARFSGDGGHTWTYCDRDAGPGSDGSEDGYQPANAGHVEAR